MQDPQYKDRLTDGLNERQHEAVVMPDKDVIILAGAGSGKTRVLTSRIAFLLREGRANPKEVLGVTFTNKAAKEMKDRLSKLVATPTSNMWIGTFHGLCHRMLRENAKIAGLPGGFSIMDSDDQSMMIKRMLKEIPDAPEDIKPKYLQDFINKLKERGIRASNAQPNSMMEDFAVPFYASYEARCARQGTIDFAELQLRTSELMQTNQEFLDRYQNKYSHILVDEFQDTNLIQYEWLKTLRGERACIFAVGDDDQSIYGFRGSNPENMTNFVDEIANGNIVRLEQNYRSTGNILAAANALIDHNTGRLGKNLWTDSGEGTRMRVLSFARDIEEAEQVGIEVKNWTNKGEDPSQIAILYRSNNQSRAYEKALMARGVPYVIYGGTRFFERMEVKNALAYLKLVINFKDDIAFRRVVNFPARGLGDVTIDKIGEVARDRLDEDGNPMSMLEASATVYDGKGRDKLESFVGLVVDLLGESQKMTLAAFIEHTLKVTGLVDFYTKNADEEDRVSNLGELLTAAKNFCEESEIPDAPSLPASKILSEFLASASLESALDKSNETDDAKATAAVRAVTLMTVHSAKGLEFDNVVIGGAEEGMFPNDKSIQEGTDEEERRLMYVAITRARKSLIVTNAKYRYVYGEKKELEPSRFLAEVPANLKDQHRFPSPYWTQAEEKPQFNKWAKKGGAKKESKNDDPFKSTPADAVRPARAVQASDRGAEAAAASAADVTQQARSAEPAVAATAAQASKATQDALASMAALVGGDSTPAESSVAAVAASASGGAKRMTFRRPG